MHIADIHLGYWQYHLKERYNDFARAFIVAMDIAINEQVDFVLLAGDLFDRRSIDALTLNQAIHGLRKLQRAGIPCLAVEGNHELAYHRDSLGWMDFLALQDYLVLLNPKFDEGEILLQPYSNHAGAYIEPLEGLRVYGLRYLGAATASALEKVAAVLADVPADGVEYTIFMTHAGIEGEVSEQMGGLSHSHIAPLREYADYVALGHIHKPYEHDNWIYNPGSLETCSVSESTWDRRGYYLVEVDTDLPLQNGLKHTATLHKNKRREFDRIHHKMDLHTSPNEFYTAIRDVIARKAKDYHTRVRGQELQPVVEVQLTGVLPFDRRDLDLSVVEEMVVEYYSPLIAQVRNLASPAEYAVETGEALSRPALERQVMAELFGRDVRYRGKRESWAKAALGLKRMALEGASAESIVDELSAQMSTVSVEPELDEDGGAVGEPTTPELEAE